jgi:hypothetical protein
VVVLRAPSVGALPLNTQPSTTHSSIRSSIRLSMRSSLRLCLRLCVDLRIAPRQVSDLLAVDASAISFTDYYQHLLSAPFSIERLF